MLSDHVIVVEKRSDFRWDDPASRVITAEAFISERPASSSRPGKVINLCRSYEYLGIGYYCSLLAEARDERVTPSVETIVDLQQRSTKAPVLAELSRSIGALAHLPRSVSLLTFHVYFGHIDDLELADLARKTFEYFRCPLLEISLEHPEGSTAWEVSTVKALDLRDIDPARDAVFVAALEAYTRRNWRPAAVRSAPKMDLAVLHDPNDPLPPSNLVTLNRLVQVGHDMNIAVELIGKGDFSRLTQFDALFIRETTAVSHHTFKFAKKAAMEGMPVIDDPVSILRCTNKAYLSELLRGNDIATPRTQLITRRTLGSFEHRLAYPVVLKVPDGAFSRNVKKAESWAQFQQVAQAMLKESAIILVQEFMYTEFDWRVGVLNGEALFAARYFMCGGHWQIMQHSDAGDAIEGRTEAVRLCDTPIAVVQAAIESANLLGNGLYGVDLKERDNGVFVIEINDNPNIDVGVEDAMLGDDLYRKILGHLLTQYESRHAFPSASPALVDRLIPKQKKRTTTPAAEVSRSALGATRLQ